jgi:hypothetical protein
MFPTDQHSSRRAGRPTTSERLRVAIQLGLDSLEAGDPAGCCAILLAALEDGHPEQAAPDQTCPHCPSGAGRALRLVPPSPRREAERRAA